MTLADRVAIMRDGLLQQVGPPRRIYDRPSNMFVARFLGSPGMNFLKGTLSSTDGELGWSTNGVRIPLPREWAAAIDAGPTRGDVFLGVRPENVGFVDQPDQASLPAEVYVSESLGNETLVRLQVHGQELVARADANYEPEVGTRVWLRVDLNRAHLFDAVDEQCII